MAKQFDIQARTIIESAALELSAAQLEELAAAAPYFKAAISHLENASPGTKDREAAAALEPVLYLLESIASLVEQAGTIKSKVIRRATPKANPTAGRSKPATPSPPKPPSTPIGGVDARSSSG